jgi:hypothetical protein
MQQKKPAASQLNVDLNIINDWLNGQNAPLVMHLLATYLLAHMRFLQPSTNREDSN